MNSKLNNNKLSKLELRKSDLLLARSRTVQRAAERAERAASGLDAAKQVRRARVAGRYHVGGQPSNSGASRCEPAEQ